MQKFAYWLEVAALGLVVGLILQGAKAWTEPSAAPPGGNVGAPINTSINWQFKTGLLGVNTSQWLISDPSKVVDNPGLLIGGKAQADDFCLTSDKTKCVSTMSGGGMRLATFPDPGIYQFLVPAGVTQIIAEARGGGAGGGGGSGNWSVGAGYGGSGGGGGGGAYSRGQYAVTPGQTIQIEVGKGGKGGSGCTVTRDKTSGGCRMGNFDTRPTGINLGENGGDSKVGSFMTAGGGLGGNGGTDSWGGTACGAGGSGPWLTGNGGDGGMGGKATGQNLFNIDGMNGIQGGDPCMAPFGVGAQGGAQGGGQGGDASGGMTGGDGRGGKPGFVVIYY